VNKESNKLVTTQVLDRETQSMYSLVITATDKGTPPKVYILKAIKNMEP